MTKQTCASKSKVALNAAFAAILAVGLSVPAASAFAAPSDDKQAEAQAALQKLNQYQSELDQASANYEAAHQEQIDAQNRVDEAQKQIEEKTAQIEKDQQRLSDRARDMYRSGDTNFLDVILGASSFEQFATTWNMLETLNGNDAELVSETKTAREDLQAAKQEAEEQAKVASDKAEEAKSVAEAADQKASEMQQTYNSLSAEAQELISQERAAQEAQQQAAAAAAEQNGTAGNDAATTITNNNRNNTTSSNSNSSSNSNKNNASSSATNNSKPQSVSGNSVVNRAYSQLGKPYQWAAVGPNSFDCSGLVSYCLTGSYSRLGTTGTFMGWTRVSSPQPGDICVNSHHCGIYIGGGQMIHAPRTGDVVKVSSVHSGMIYVRY
ncbi:MAG: NlpC/P60 family protein [Eggerthellaceae bacterium]|nr:NlpC/P60 family protein [Eggerthellaceae bacterium]